MTIGSHQATIGKSQEHFTPKWIIDALGPFDLDPCAGRVRPWDCAVSNWHQNGLESPWTGSGMIWLNPPFDRRTVGLWVRKLADHGNGIALLHARTEAAWFEPVWELASSILFMADRIKFCRVDGTTQPANSGAPPVLVSFGARSADRLFHSGIAGFLTSSWCKRPPVPPS